jgi:rubrerythrin
LALEIDNPSPKEDPMEKSLDDMTLQEAWELAIRREQEAQELYQKLAEKEPAMHDLFSFLLEQEKHHEQRLQDEYDKAFRPEW